MVSAVVLKATILRAADRLMQAPAWQFSAHAAAGFWSLIFPTACVRCGAWDQSLCGACQEDFRRATVRPFQAEAGAESLPGQTGPWAADRQHDAGGTSGSAGFVPLPVTAAGVYAASVSSVVLAFKNHGHTDLQRPLAAALAGALHAACATTVGSSATGGYLLVPVPGRSSAIRRRGYDPLHLILQGLAKRGELPAGTSISFAVRPASPLRGVGGSHGVGDRSGSAGAVLRLAALVRNVGGSGGQKGLGRRGRQRRVAGSMIVPSGARSRVEGRVCLVVDDVLTTGSTVAEATRALRAAGAEVAGAVVIAAARAPAAVACAPSVPEENSGRSGMNKGTG